MSEEKTPFIAWPIPLIMIGRMSCFLMEIRSFLRYATNMLMNNISAM